MNQNEIENLIASLKINQDEMENLEASLLVAMQKHQEIIEEMDEEEMANLMMPLLVAEIEKLRSNKH